jgi:hypothetical protein
VTHVSILCLYLFSLCSLFSFAIRLPLTLRFTLAPFSLALCMQRSRVDTGSFTFTFKAQPNDKCYIFIILVTVLGCYVDYLTKLYQFRSLATKYIRHTHQIYIREKRGIFDTFITQSHAIPLGGKKTGRNHRR